VLQQSIQQVIDENSVLLFGLRADFCSEIGKRLTAFIELWGDIILLKNSKLDFKYTVCRTVHPHEMGRACGTYGGE
jgi:hypothetical protein